MNVQIGVIGGLNSGHIHVVNAMKSHPVIVVHNVGEEALVTQFDSHFCQIDAAALVYSADDPTSIAALPKLCNALMGLRIDSRQTLPLVVICLRRAGDGDSPTLARGRQFALTFTAVHFDVDADRVDVSRIVQQLVDAVAANRAEPSFRAKLAQFFFRAQPASAAATTVPVPPLQPGPIAISSPTGVSARPTETTDTVVAPDPLPHDDTVEHDGLLWSVITDDDAPDASPSNSVAISLAELRDSLTSSSDAKLYLDDDNANEPADVLSGTRQQHAAMRLARAKLAFVRKSPSTLLPVPTPANESVDSAKGTLFSEFVLCVDVGSYQTKIGIAIADPLLAGDVSLSPFVAVTCESTFGLFRDATGLAARLEALVLSLLPPRREGGRPRGSLRDLAHVMLAFPGFYYHQSQALRFAKLFGNWSSEWARRLNRDELARVLSIEAQRLTFMNSRTASGWAFIERFGCAAHAGVVLTLGANAGVFGVWRGLMCFTRPRHKKDRSTASASASEQEVAKAAFDSGSVIANKATGESVRSLLRYDRDRAVTGESLGMATLAACEQLLAFGTKLSARLKVSKPALLIVYVAGGGATDDVVRKAQPAIAQLLRQQFGEQVAVQVELAEDPLYNDLRGLLYFHRTVVARSGADVAQGNVDQPTALLIETQMRAHDVITNMLVLAHATNPTRAAELLAFERWLIAHRLAAVGVRQPDERAAYPALDMLLEDNDFMQLLGEQPDGLFLLAKLVGNPSGKSEMCAWIAQHWCEITLALLGRRAVVALKNLTDLLVETPTAPVAANKGATEFSRVINSIHLTHVTAATTVAAVGEPTTTTTATATMTSRGVPTTAVQADPDSSGTTAAVQLTAAVNSELRNAGAAPVTERESKLITAVAPVGARRKVPPPLPARNQIASVVTPVDVARNCVVQLPNACAPSLARSLQQRRRAIAMSTELSKGNDNDGWEEEEEEEDETKKSTVEK